MPSTNSLDEFGMPWENKQRYSAGGKNGVYLLDQVLNEEKLLHPNSLLVLFCCHTCGILVAHSPQVLKLSSS